MDNDFTTSSTLKKEANRLGIPLRAIAYKDTLPFIKDDGGYIVNMASSDAPAGTHWVALWKEGDETFYFDSFGLDMPTEIKDRITTKRAYRNGKWIQDIDAGYCGAYCMEWLEEMNKTSTTNKEDMKRFQNYFSKDTKKNIPILRRLMHR